jgi:hypothetical protein
MKIILVFSLFFLAAGAIAVAQAPGHFFETGNMSVVRAGHTATLLPSGKVLIAGGGGSTLEQYEGGAGSSAELYDPDNGIFITTGSMSVPRAGHSATLLPDDRVLIVGGSTEMAVELYDPESGSFSRGASMSVPRTAHTATLLNNGKVLIAGGFNPQPLSVNEPPPICPPGGCGSLNTAELYDPANGTFTPTGNMTMSHFSHRATLLADGRVLISPAADAPDVDLGRTEIYDPDSGTFHAVVLGQPVLAARTEAAYTANLLLNGKVLITAAPTECDYVAGDALLFDPASETFSPAASMVTARCVQTGTSLASGAVLVSGSWGCRVSADTDVYDAASGTFQRGPGMMINRWQHQATLLADGRVLVTGGLDTCGQGALSRAEVCAIGSYTEPPPPVLLSIDGNQEAVLHTSTHQVVSPANPAVAGETLEIYALDLIDGAVIPPQIAIGGRLAEVLYFGKAPGYPTLNQINVRVPAGVTPGPAVPVRMNYLGRPSNLVTIGVGEP